VVQLLACTPPDPLPPLPLEGEKLAQNYWSMPVAQQKDSVPPSSDPALHPLSAERCGRCHVAQYEQWKTSIHAGAMGPGIKARLFGKSDEFIHNCYLCHAPLAEQLPKREDKVLEKRPEVPDDKWNWFQQKQKAVLDGEVDLIANEAFDEHLQKEGLTCAACHLRDGVTYAAPRSGRPLTVLPDDEGFHRKGIVRTPYLQKAEFCRDCHQFIKKNPPNGKAIQNTWIEWKEGPFGKAGVTCQGCHMAGGAHSWWGIHNKTWVSGALEARFDVKREGNDRYRGGFYITSRAVGHAFPSYVTPRAETRIWLVDEKGQEIPGSRQVFYLAREMDLRPESQREFYDTRILPGNTFSVGYDFRVPPGVTAKEARAQLFVDPDHDYRGKFERDAGKANVDPAHAALLEAALQKVKDSQYVAIERTVTLDAAP
jgi:hypothetical protein